MAMNTYGTRARKHWEQWLPDRYRQLDNPDSFFSELGEEIEAQIQTLAQQLAGSDPRGETFMEKLGRLNMAHFDAEAQVLRRMAWLDPEDEALAN
jgi:hypothetical protein